MIVNDYVRLRKPLQIKDIVIKVANKLVCGNYFIHKIK